MFDSEDEEEVKTPKTKIKCRTCYNLNYDYFSSRYEPYEEIKYWFCGLHGRAHVDPDGMQVDLNKRGGCGYFPKVKKKEPKQLSLFDLLKI